MANEKLQINLEELLEQFKKELSTQFDEIFSNKEISKVITSDKLKEIKEEVFDEITDHLEKNIKEKNEDNIKNIKHIFENLSDKYKNQFKVLKESYLSKTKNELEEQSKIVEEKQTQLQSELIIASKLQSESIKLLDGKEKSKVERKIPLKTFKPKEKKETKNNNIIIKRLDNFESKIEKRDESIKRTIDMVYKNQNLDPNVLDDEKDKEKQELADTEQNEQEIERIDGEIDDVVADNKSELDEIDVKDNDKEKKKLDLSEEGVVSWLTDKLMDILAAAGILSLGLIGKVWDSFSNNEKIIEKDQDETQKEIEETVAKNVKETEELIKSFNVQDEEEVKVDEIENETKNLTEEISKAEESQKEENEDMGSKAVEDMESIEKQVDEDGETGASGGGSSTPELPAGFKTSPSIKETSDVDNPNEKAATNIIKENEKTKQESEKQTQSELENLEKENSKEVPDAKQYSKEDEDENIKKQDNIENVKSVDEKNKLEKSELDGVDESLKQISTDSFDIDSTLGESKIDEEFSKPNENETIVEEKKIKTKVIQTDSVTLMPKQEINIEEIVQRNKVVEESKLNKVIEERSKIKDMKEYLPRERTNVQITKQIFNMDDFYSILTETVSVVNNLTELIEKNYNKSS